MTYNRLCASAVVYRTNTVTGETFFLLITKANKDVRSGKCILPKGGIDPGVGPMTAARIEVQEEAAVHCSENGVMLGSYVLYNCKDSCINHVEVFGLKYLGLTENDTEGRKVIWTGFDEALDLIDPYLAPYIIRMHEHLEATRIHQERKSKKEFSK